MGETEVSQIKSLRIGQVGASVQVQSPQVWQHRCIRDWSCQTSSPYIKSARSSAIILGIEPSLQKLIKILTCGLFSTNLQKVVYFGKRQAVEKDRLQNFRFNHENDKTLKDS